MTKHVPMADSFQLTAPLPYREPRAPFEPESFDETGLSFFVGAINGIIAGLILWAAIIYAVYAVLS